MEIFISAPYCFRSSKKFNVKIIFVFGALRPDWRVMNSEQQKIQLDQFVRMARQIVKNPNENLITVTSLVECKAQSMGSHILFESRVLKKRGIWHHCNTLTTAIFDQLGCGTDQLFGLTQFGPLRITPSKPFVVWHVRKGNLLPGIQEADEDFVTQYFYIRKILGSAIEIVVVSSPNGLQFLNQLAQVHNLKLSSSRQYSEDFIGDMNLVHNSVLYIQLGNGGMYSAAVTSKSSYFLGTNVFVTPKITSGVIKPTRVLSAATKGFGINIRKSRVNPWQTELQVLEKAK